MKHRLMFVDDNSELLKGLQRMLRPHRAEWDMAFVPGGEEAMAEMSRGCFDVVVSDMRMPGIDGARLLQEVRESCPRTVRIVLSGQADLEAIVKGLHPIHQYLAKPCSPDTLVGIINRTCSLRDLLKPTALQAAVAKVSALPAHPDAVARVREELQSKEPNIELIAAIMARDIGMAAKVLQLINSAFFGPSQSLADPHAAARILGADVLRPLVLDQSIFDAPESYAKESFLLDSLMDRSRRLASSAAAIARDMGGDDEAVAAAYTAGLLHSIGKLVLRKEHPEQYFAALMSAFEQRTSFEEVEQSTFGANHHDIGAYLLGLWGLPGSVVQAVASAHRPTCAENHHFSPTTALHIAGAFFSKEATDTEGAWPLDEWYIDMLGISSKLKSWSELCKRMGDISEEQAL